MKRVTFYMDSGYVGAKTSEVVEFEDEATDEEISVAHMEWLSQYGGWYPTEE